MPLCLTCSSNLNPSSVARGWTTPCCGKTVCDACVKRNPRLQEYDPCLYCGDPVAGTLARRPNAMEREDVFRIEDEDGEDRLSDEPPAYTPVSGDRSQPKTGFGDRTADDDVGHAAAADPGGVKPGQGEQGSSPKDANADEDELEEVEVRHPVSKGDTILSIARRYGADPHEILKLNNLPYTTLSTQPHLLRTRQSLIITKRRVRRSTLPPTLLFDHPADPSPSNEDAQRERERALKRFQLLTKSLDSRVGNTYLSLSQLDEDRLDFLTSETTDREIEQALTAKEGMRGKVVPTVANREDRAVEAFFDDDEWERRAGAPAVTKQGGWKRIGDPAKLGLKV